MTRKVLVATGVVAVAAVLGVAAAWASGSHETTSAADGPVLEISGRQLDPGDALTVGGDGCPAEPPGVGAWAVEVWLAPAPGSVEWDPAFGDPVATVAPDADGTWEVTVTVPEYQAEYRLEAACLDETTPPDGFIYRHERLVIG